MRVASAWSILMKEVIELWARSPMNVRHLSAWQQIAPQLDGRSVGRQALTSPGLDPEAVSK